MATSERSKGLKSAKAEASVPTEPTETNSITFEWPLRGLKQMFDSSKTDTKSKVIKSIPFGGARWTVLFYAQSGHEQFCSLYLNAEPLPHERQNPLLACATPYIDIDKHREGGTSGGSGAGAGSGGSGSNSNNLRFKSDGSLDESWKRKGLFRFTFNIQTLEDKTILGTKEAHDHAFSSRTSNWGWAQFAKRDHVYYKNSDVIREDAFLISVTITASPEKPKAAEPLKHPIPPMLVQAMGSLLDDPEHSDVVFHLVPAKRRVADGPSRPKKVYAIRKILAARSEYFRLMFEGGFQEAELEETSDDDEMLAFGGAQGRAKHAPAHPHRSHHAAARAGGGGPRSTLNVDVDNDADTENESDAQDLIFDDSDEDLEEFDGPVSAQNDPSSPADTSQRELPGTSYKSPNEDNGDEEDRVLRRGQDARRGSEVGTSEGRDAAVLTTYERSTSSVSHQSANSTLQDELHSSAFNSWEGSVLKRSDSVAEDGRKTVHGADVSGTQQSRYGDAEGRLSDASFRASPSQELLKAQSGSNTAMQVPGHVRRRTRSSTDRRKRRKVTVLDSAYPTFKALLFFLYTDTVEFAPLTSSFLPPHVAADDGMDTSTFATTRSASGSGSSMIGRPRLHQGAGIGGSFTEEMHIAHQKRKAVIEAFRDKNPDRPAPCSAKAMYRLADKLDIPDLKKRAQEHIALSLTTDNIVWEVFSGFNTQYPDIRKMETDFLLQHWPKVKRSSAMKSIFWRASAHPGLAEVWPHLLEYLEYKQPDAVENVEAGY